MKRLLVFSFYSLLFLPFFSIGQEAPPVFDWQSTYGGTNYDAAAKIIKSGTGYLIVGTTNSINGDISNSHGMFDVWVAKVSSTGAIIWKKTFGGSNDDVAVSLLQLASGKIFVVANTKSANYNVTFNHGTTDIWLLELSSSGNLLWQKTFGGSGVDEAHSMILTSDGKLLIAGTTESNNGDISGNRGGSDFCLLKTDTLGNLIWEKSFGGTSTENCNTVIETPDSGFLASGNSNSNDSDVTGNKGVYDFWVVKTDSAGNLQWQRSFGGSQNESALSSLVNTSGNFVIAGYTNSNDSDVTDNRGSSDYWMITVDTAGTLLNEHTYGGSNSDVAYSITQAADGGYLLVGGTTSHDFDVSSTGYPSDGNHGSFTEDVWLMKTDSIGHLNWARCYGGSAMDRALSALQTADGGFVVAGYSYSNDFEVTGNHGGGDMWVFKLSCLNPVSAFTFADDTICIHALVNLNNASVNAGAYTWLSGGIPFNSHLDVNFQFDTLRQYQISLVAATCYSRDTFSHSFTVIDHPSPQISASKPYLCSGEALTLNTTGYGNLLWSTGDTTSGIVISNPGNYSVTVTNHQCSGSAAMSIAQYPTPDFSLGNDTTFCMGNVFTLHAPPGYQSYLWQNGSTDSIFSTLVSGVYSVTVSSAYCSSTDSIQVISANCMYPVAEFFAVNRSMCVNTCISYIDQSSYADSWSWYFEGGTPDTSTAQNPSNICYHTPGTYLVTLTVANVHGTSTATRNSYIVVNAYPATPGITISGFSLTSTPAASYQWLQQNVVINGATSQTYMAQQSGFYSVQVGNGTDCYSTSDSVYLNITNVGGYNGGGLPDVFVYPNPANDRVFILARQSTTGGTGHYGQGIVFQSLKITDEVGKIILQKDFTNEDKQHEMEISTASVANGIYFLHFESADGTTVVKRLVVAH